MDTAVLTRDRVAAAQPLVELEGVRHLYGEGGAKDHIVLENVNLTLRSNEIVSLLGRAMGGTLRLASQPGRGLRAEVNLPAA